MLQLLSDLYAVFKEIMSTLFEFIPKVLHIILWAVLGVIVLPCVFIANHFYPMWVKWGEGF
jgi:hypothetical protein